MDNYSLFWGPGHISTIDEPRGAYMCRSSTPAVLAVLTRFVDYYSLFWGPGHISTIDEPRGAFMCRSSTPVVLAGRHVSWTITHCFGVLDLFPRSTNPGVRLCVGHQHP